MSEEVTSVKSDVEGDDVIIPEKILEALQKDQILRPTAISRIGGERNMCKKRVRECEMCQENESKYSCPGCSMRTCSLACVKQHKLDTECTGKRPRSFCLLPQMDESVLREDYFFLKEVERLAGETYRASSRQSKREKKNKMINKHKRGKLEDLETKEEDHKPTQSTLPVALRKLVGEANARGVTLRLMPRGMTRRRANTTYYAYRTKRLFWRIEWKFNEHLEPEEHVKMVSERVDDDTILNEPLTSIVDSITMTSNSGESLLTIPQRKELRKRCNEYLKCSIEDLCLLLPMLNTPAEQPQFYQLDGKISIARNLAGKTILEFPTLLVVPPTCLERYIIIDSQ